MSARYNEVDEDTNDILLGYMRSYGEKKANAEDSIDEDSRSEDDCEDEDEEKEELKEKEEEKAGEEPVKKKRKRN